MHFLVIFTLRVHDKEINTHDKLSNDQTTFNQFQTIH